MTKEHADLHLHTTFSDGFLSPEDVLKNAFIHRLKAISITDHETVEGVAIAVSEAKQYGIEVIPGIELSASTGAGEIHLLGYFIDYQDVTLQKTLAELKKKRKNRLKKIVNNLSAQDVHVDFDALLKFAGPGTMGRLHLAHFLCRNKIVSHIYEAFDKYISSDKPAYEKVDALTPQEAIKLILSAGGIPVLAHPESKHLDDLIRSLTSIGLKGLEVYHSKFDKKDSQCLLAMARKHDLLVTGGSDCHGEGKLIPLIGKIKLPYAYVEKLKNHAGINYSVLKTYKTEHF